MKITADVRNDASLEGESVESKSFRANSNNELKRNREIENNFFSREKIYRICIGTGERFHFVITSNAILSDNEILFFGYRALRNRGREARAWFKESRINFHDAPGELVK